MEFPPVLLTISTTMPSAADLGYLLHKHPDRVQSFDLPFGAAHVFYPHVTQSTCTAALLLDIDPIGLSKRKRGGGGDSFTLRPYVNDRPYVASSFMSVAIARVYGTALSGKCDNRPELVSRPLPFEARITALPCRGQDDLLERLFEPLGYAVEAQRYPLDSHFPDWGDSHYQSVTLRGQVTLSALLTHLYVLIPVLDNDKHYWIGEEELEKLLRRGEGWLADHPAKELITRRYLKHQSRLARQALVRLADDEDGDPDARAREHQQEEEDLEQSITATGDIGASPSPDDDRPNTLHDVRLAAVRDVALEGSAASLVDLGCGDGRLLKLLLHDKSLTRLVGMDVSMRSLRRAAERLRLDRMTLADRQRVELLHGSLTYRDERLAGFDVATCVEVIEHLEPQRLATFERVLFEHARPGRIIITTPNREYNVTWEALPAGKLRHRDHRFEWTRREFESWGSHVGSAYGYTVRFSPIGPESIGIGAPTQMAVFDRMSPDRRDD